MSSHSSPLPTPIPKRPPTGLPLAASPAPAAAAAGGRPAAQSGGTTTIGISLHTQSALQQQTQQAAGMIGVSRSPFSTTESPSALVTAYPLSHSAAAAAAGTSTATVGTMRKDSPLLNPVGLLGSPSGRFSADKDLALSPAIGLLSAGSPTSPNLEEFESLPPSAVLGLTRSNSRHSVMEQRAKPTPYLAAAIVPTNIWVQQRLGSILSRGMILKADHFPVDQQAIGLDLHVIGASNFQQVKGHPIYATGQPTVSGIRTVLNLLHLKQNPRRRVTWMNLREEPVLYLNHRPFVLRELDQALRNMNDFAGIDAQRLSNIESRMKLDVLAEAEGSYGNILVHDEQALGELRACWNSVHESNVKTSAEVYEQLLREGYAVDYLRIPVTAESVFESKQVDMILKCFLKARQAAMQTTPHATGSMTRYQAASQSEGVETIFVINDQMGRGRSTIGMIAIYLLMKHVARGTDTPADEHARKTALSQPLPEHGYSHAASDVHDGLAAYRRGDFDIMLKLQRMLKDGKQCKREVDIAIDACGRVHHLRDQIVESFIKSEHSRADDQHQLFSSVTASYLKRYFYLVCFQSYLHSFCSGDLESIAQPGKSFTDWWASHPELARLMATLTLEDEELREMVASKESAAAGGEQLTSAPSSSASSSDGEKQLTVFSPNAKDLSESTDFCSLLDRYVFTRSLPVLSKRTIIKSEAFHFSTRHQRLLFEHGLPNFRYYENLPLAATAQPNVRGIKNILHLLQDTARRRDRRIELEADLSAAADELGGEFSAITHGSSSDASSGSSVLDARLKDVIARHAHADSFFAHSGLVGASTHPTRVLGHHSTSALQLNRSLSDASEEVEAMRYRPHQSIVEDDHEGAHEHSHQNASDFSSRPPLHHAASLPSYVNCASPQILWICLREEPVLFINSEPYLLRDYIHPFRVLTEFNTGMTRERTEQVEEGFKVDVIHELQDSITKASGHHETDDASRGAEQAKLVVHEETAAGQIRPRYETVRAPLIDHVQTTAEVYAQLRREGYNVSYHRVPLRVEETPGLKSFDRLFDLLNSHQIVEDKINVVFSCQKGGRRSTMGMVVCVLMLMHQRSVHYSIRSDQVDAAAAAATAGAGTAAEKLAALNLNLKHHGATEATAELQSVAGAGQDDANAHGHTVSISAHFTSSKKPPSIPTHPHTPPRTGKGGAEQTTPPRGSSSRSTEPGTLSSDTHVAVSADKSNAAIATHGAPVTQPPSTGTNAPPGKPLAGAANDATAMEPSPPTPLSPTMSSASTGLQSASPAAAPAPSMKKSPSSVSIHIQEISHPEARAKYGRGEFKGILAITRILKEGGKVKEEVDVAIDAVGGIVNIRDSIAQAKSRAEGGRQAETGLSNKALKYLESYAYLICFNSYLRERREAEEETRAAASSSAAAVSEQKSKEAADTADKKRVQFGSDSDDENDFDSTTPTDSPTAASGSNTKKADGFASFPSFSAWIASRPELRRQLEEIHRDPHDALKMSAFSIADDQFASVFESRRGHVLINGSLLKNDWFVGSMNKKIPQIIDGAINFRPIEGFPCAGTGIPTAKGIRGILEFYTTPPTDLAAQGYAAFAPLWKASTLLWFNLREEPLLYVNERPFVLRDADNPYVNIEHTGINTRRLEAMERQLKRDILEEAERMRSFAGHPHVSSSPDGSPDPSSLLGDRFLAADEDENGNLIAVWQAQVSKTTILTPQQAFLRCFEEVALSKQDGSTEPLDISRPRKNNQAALNSVTGANFKASYFRTPITDEQAPSPSTMNDIIMALETARDASNLVLVFNCQMGRGRTTTGLIIGCLWCVHRGKVPNYESWLNQDVRRRSFVPGATGPTTGKSLLSPPGPVNVPPLTPQNILPTTSTSSTYMEPSTITGDDEQSTQKRAEEFANGRKHGWYKVIQSLVRLIQDGPQIKRQTDRVIDHSGTFQNLREAIYETQELALTCLPRKKPFFVRRGLNYLIRYFYLILINAYMSQEVAYNFERMSFADWLAKRQELTNLLNSVTFPEEMKAPVEVKPAVKRVAPMSTSPPVVVTPVAK